MEIQQNLGTVYIDKTPLCCNWDQEVVYIIFNMRTFGILVYICYKGQITYVTTNPFVRFYMCDMIKNIFIRHKTYWSWNGLIFRQSFFFQMQYIFYKCIRNIGMKRHPFVYFECTSTTHNKDIPFSQNSSQYFDEISKWRTILVLKGLWAVVRGCNQ